MSQHSLLPFLLVALALAGLASAAHGESQIVRRVFGLASAKANTTLPTGAAFTTAARSRSELASTRGVVRVGENADLQTLPNGLALRRGVTLVASAPSGLRKTIEVRAPGYRLKVKGTAQIAFQPGRSLKVVTLEGSVTVSLDSMLGEFEELQPGQMLIINPSDHRLPEPVEIDVQRLVSTSTLAGGEFGALPTAANIAAAAAAQSSAYERGDLLATGLALRGVENAIELQKSRLGLREEAARTAVAEAGPSAADRIELARFTFPNDLADPNAVPRERPYTFPGDLSTAFSISDTEFQRDPIRNPGRTNILYVELAPESGPDDLPLNAPQISGNVSVSADFFSGAPRMLRLFTSTLKPGFDRIKILADTVVSTPAGVALEIDAKYGLDIDGATLRVGDALATSELLYLHAASGGITVKNRSLLRGGRIRIDATAPGTETSIDRSTIEAQRDLKIGVGFTPTGITIRNSSELRSVLANLQLTAFRAPVTVESSTLSAKANLLIDAYVSPQDSMKKDVTTPGRVSVRDAQLMAQAIRIRGFADGGDALVIDGSTLNAAQLIKLYAEGASTLRFRNAVTLNTAMAVLAGQTVEVDPGGKVTISGKGRVFTDNPNFNTGSYGTIDAKKGLTPGTFSARGDFKR